MDDLKSLIWINFLTFENVVNCYNFISLLIDKLIFIKELELDFNYLILL
jgi:hypothetical protein